MKLKPIHKKRLAILAEWLEAGGEAPHIKFGMYTYLKLLDKNGNETYDKNEACNSICCMAGALAQTFGDPSTNVLWLSHVGIGISEYARKLVGLDQIEGNALFEPAGLDFRSITPQQAARVVRHLIATGNVDWSASVMNGGR